MLAYYMEEGVWVTARSGRNQVRVEGAEWDAVLDAAQNARILLLTRSGNYGFRRTDYV